MGGGEKSHRGRRDIGRRESGKRGPQGKRRGGGGGTA